MLRLFYLPPEAGDLEKRRARAFARQAGLTDEQGDKMMELARSYVDRIANLDLTAAELKNRHWPNPTPEVMSLLGQLQAEKDQIVASIVASLPAKLGNDAAFKLAQHVQNHVKPKTKVLAIP